MAPKEAGPPTERAPAAQHLRRPGCSLRRARIIYTYTRRTHTHRLSHSLLYFSFFLYMCAARLPRAREQPWVPPPPPWHFSPLCSAGDFRNGGASWISPNLLKNVLRQLSSPRVCAGAKMRAASAFAWAATQNGDAEIWFAGGLGDANPATRVKNGDSRLCQPRIYWSDARVHTSRLPDWYLFKCVYIARLKLGWNGEKVTMKSTFYKSRKYFRLFSHN